MATDPIKGITGHDVETRLALDLPATLARLAALPPSVEAPYLTLTLDWRPDGAAPNVRPGKVAFAQQSEEFLAAFAPHTPVHGSLGADLERVAAYLEEDAPAEAQGIVVVACSARDVFEPVPLALPLATRLTAGPTPALAGVVRVAEDYPAYAVLLGDQHEASLTLIAQTRPERQVEVVGSDYPRKQQQGGWSQRRYQNRADEKLEAFARGVAEETRRELGAAGIDLLVLAADEAAAPSFLAELKRATTATLVGPVRLAMTATDRQVVEATLPIAEQAEREREQAAVAAARDGAGAGAGGKGTAGPEETLTALQTGQVMTLVMNDDFAAAGWADYTLPVYGAGRPPKRHPAGGDAANIVPVALEEELVRLALQVGAEVEVVRTAVPVGAEEQAHVPDADAPTPRSAAARLLDELGGVGAVLRYALDAGQSTADL